MVTQTERLILREMAEADMPALCKILQDEEVMYAYMHAFSLVEAREWLNKQILRYKTDGFGLWAAVLKDSNEMIGQCGLTMQDYNGEQVAEVGYLFQKAYWHKGYATEAAIAAKRYAFEVLGLKSVYSIIRDNNVASQKVAERNEMQICGTIIKRYYNTEMPHLVYVVHNKNYDN